MTRANRLWHVWTDGHKGATGESPSGPLHHGPILAASKQEAREKIEPTLTSWDGAIKKVTTDEDYRPRKRYDW